MKVIFVIRKVTGITGTPEYYDNENGYPEYDSLPDTAKHFNAYAEAEWFMLNNIIDKGCYQIDKIFIKY